MLKNIFTSYLAALTSPSRMRGTRISLEKSKKYALAIIKAQFEEFIVQAYNSEIGCKKMAPQFLGQPIFIFISCASYQGHF